MIILQVRSNRDTCTSFTDPKSTQKRSIQWTMSPSGVLFGSSRVLHPDACSKIPYLLIPTSNPYGRSHHHRTIEVGKKKLPDPHAHRHIIWGMVGSVGTDKADLKTAFGAYDYETKTKGRFRLDHVVQLIMSRESRAQ